MQSPLVAPGLEVAQRPGAVPTTRPIYTLPRSLPDSERKSQKGFRESRQNKSLGRFGQVDRVGVLDFLTPCKQWAVRVHGMWKPRAQLHSVQPGLGALFLQMKT